jgi:hypothetical protein
VANPTQQFSRCDAGRGRQYPDLPPGRAAIQSHESSYSDFTPDAPMLERQLEQAGSRQHWLDYMDQLSSEAYTACTMH